MLRDVHFVGDDTAMQALVEQEVGAFGNVVPGREGAWLLLEGRGLLGVVQIGAHLAPARLAIGLEGRGQLLEQVGAWTEMADVRVALVLRLGHQRAHLRTVVAMERVALDDGGGHFLAPEDLLKRRLDGGRSRAGGARDDHDGVFYGHGCGFRFSLIATGAKRSSGAL